MFTFVLCHYPRDNAKLEMKSKKSHFLQKVFYKYVCQIKNTVRAAYNYHGM